MANTGTLVLRLEPRQDFGLSVVFIPDVQVLSRSEFSILSALNVHLARNTGNGCLLILLFIYRESLEKGSSTPLHTFHREHNQGFKGHTKSQFNQNNQSIRELAVKMFLCEATLECMLPRGDLLCRIQWKGP